MEREETLFRRIAEGWRPGVDEAEGIVADHSPGGIRAVAGRLRTRFLSDLLDTCSIMNARSGRCTEDCKWCSQSAFHRTDIGVYPLVEAGEAVGAALYNAAKGVRRFSLVTSGRAMTDGEIARCSEIYEKIAAKTPIGLCASMGLLDKGQLETLYRSGVRRYHCNLETAPSYFSTLCTTHTTQDKVRTIRWVQEVGMEVCSGGIIGMGETMRHRLELAVALRELGVRSIPLNVLNPIAGTALEGAAPLADDEILLTAAMFRLLNPEAHIRFAGGRNRFKHLERQLLHGGVSASIVGDMLTTAGSDIDTDKEMFLAEGFSI